MTAKSATFTNDLWNEFVQTLGTKLSLVTTFQSQPNAQSEYVGHLISYLHQCLTPYDKDWTKYLSIAEFTVNSHITRATGQSPYSLLYNQQPNIPQSLITPTVGMDLPKDVQDYIDRWQTTMHSARTALLHGESWQEI